ncbi:SGNH/GDSL hydrolase family protein [Arthrobacter crusticola]|uniref:SGNH/GDSL hydrolase family protein n=1 Tax=Arthrobacter crusticola TaxID=2547960 RepID=A0A4R5U223_9MICC|nr:SGNH/GDSL hydrolase family protein [Arthrobacter crusticola]TDK27681.1 SGNH/GDSL hydrolase family protein [Arthrobacter crusticola]
MQVPTEEFLDRSDGTLGAGPFRARMDEDGFQMTGNPIDPAATPLVFLGDSFVEANFVDEDARFSSVVERALPHYRILNGGYSGSTTLQLLNVLVNKVYPIVGLGGKVLFFVGQSDVDHLSKTANYWTSHFRGTPIVPGKEPSGTLPQGTDATERLLRMVVHAAQSLDLDLVLAVSPFREGDFNTDELLRHLYRRDRVFFQEQRERRLGVVESVVKVAAATGTRVIDFHSLVGGDPTWFYDELHLNQYGHGKFATLLAGEIGKHF